MVTKPLCKPERTTFSSGPCPKHPGWEVGNLGSALIGRSHRSKAGKERLAKAIAQTRKILGVPDDYRIGIVPASDTGAVEMALWSLLGERAVTMLAWESFGAGWITDVVKHLKLENVTTHTAEYGALPDLEAVNRDDDIVFTWNGTTSGVKVPHGDWIAKDRQGLTICDATSAAFAMYLPWEKLDVTTYSWQKVLGGEAAHGMIILSPRAVKRLESYTPVWPLPKIFRLTKNGKLIENIFAGATINTPSMLCVEDYLNALAWAESIGGLKALIARSQSNLKAMSDWVARSAWVDFLACDEKTISNTSVCLKITDRDVTALDIKGQSAFTKRMTALLEEEAVAYDIGAYRDAPPGLRVWAGATVNLSDIEALIPWLDWSYKMVKAEFFS